jgi:iron complex outermembrane receptor protein
MGWGSAHAQLVTGRVTDTQGQPLPNATLLVTGRQVGVFSDEQGVYRLELKADWAGQTLSLQCSYIGFQTATYSWKVPQTLPPRTQIDFELSPYENLDPVVVSAGRFAQRSAEVTVSMEVLPPRLVEQRGTTSLENALEQTPGVSFVDGEPQIRSGSGFSYGAGSRVMILVDELPILSGDAGRPSWGFLPLENLEQVEVIKGASSVLYGSSALSGVIHVRTRFPDARPLTRITVQHGAYSPPRSAQARTWTTVPQLANVRFLHSQRLGTWDVVLGGNLLGDDGHLAPADSTQDRPFNPFTVDRFAATSQARLNAALRKRESRVAGLVYGVGGNWQFGESLNTLIWDRAPDRIYGSYEGASTRTEQLIGTVDPYVQYLSPGDFKHSLRGRWQHLVNANNNSQSNASNVYHAEYQLAFEGERWGLKGLRVTGGGLGQWAMSNAELYSGGSSDGNNRAMTLGAYAQLDQSWKRTKLSGGVRYEVFQVNQVRASKPVFRAGVNQAIGQAGYLRASYGQGFRFPTIAERYIRTGLGSLQIYPNENLLPEFAQAWEVGFKQGLRLGGFQGFVDAAVFRQDFDQFIEFTFGQWGLPSDPIVGLGFMSVNTGSSRVTGAEGSVTGRWKGERLEVDVLAGYTYTRPVTLSPDLDYSPNPNYPATYLSTSHDTTNYVLKYRSPHLVRMDVHVTAPRWFAGFSARYQSQLDNFDQAFLQWGVGDWLAEHPRQPWVFDLRVGVPLAEAHRISLVVNNVFNAEYSLRPLVMESPRLTQLMYTYEIQ